MSWTTEIPNKPGWYWLYGDPYALKKTDDGARNKLHACRVYKGANSLVYVADGHFVCPEHCIYVLFWLPMKTPNTIPGNPFYKEQGE
jgi:hypothetical protein